MKHIIAYGSLRRGGDWFRSLSIRGVSEDIKFVKCVTIKGFELYNLLDPETSEIKEDPIACKLVGDDKSEITVDIISVSEEFYKEINRIISHSDFKAYTISVSNIIGEIYIYDAEVKANMKIESGNFFSRNLKKAKLAIV
jgi:gamma-glutamylcyclotransferase (GGCT)/AIG2-like uncharacterized protein YtfP